jgi:K+-sensing histidine kinase KdpD
VKAFPWQGVFTMVDGNPIQSDRLLAVYQAALSAANELELEPVLQTIADRARELLSAKYAAIGVTNDDLTIKQFITSGIDYVCREAIGPLPHGKGLLGAIIHDRVPLRIAKMRDDPRSVGFPPNHPPMTSLLGVPIAIGERVLGNLYLCDREDGQAFSAEDQRAVEALATHAASAIERAELVQQLAIARSEADRQSESVRSLLEQLPVGVYVPESGGRAAGFMNPEAVRLFGSPPAVDQAPAAGPALFHEDGRLLAVHELPEARVARGERVRGVPMWAGSGTTGRTPVLVSAIPLESLIPGTGPSETVVVLQDMTRMREADQLKTDFISLVSHELNTPITTIIGAAHLLQSGASSLTEIDRHELLSDLVAESDRLAKMLSNLITVTAVYAGSIGAQTEPVLLDHVVRRAIEAARRRGRDRWYFAEVPRDLPPVEADPELLDHVLANIMDNAIKYGSPTGQIRVRAELVDSHVILHVDDDGPGVDPSQISRIFERFYRADSHTTSHGLGLGLYLCRFLMEAQGGRIWAEASGIGTGITISMEFNVATGWVDDPAEWNES